MKLSHLLTVCILAAVPVAAFAKTLTFEDILNANVSAPYGGGTDLGGFYQGVTFGAGVQGIVATSGFPAHSGDYQLWNADIANGNIIMAFSNPVTDVSFWYSTLFGFTATAYDKNNNPLSSLTKAPNTDGSVGIDSFLDFGLSATSPL